MTINRSATEPMALTIGKVLSNVTLSFTKTATSSTNTLIPTVITSTLRYLKLELDTTVLTPGEYSMQVIEDADIVKELKVEVLDYQEIKEYQENRIYGEFNG